MLSILEVDDGETTVFKNSTHFHGHEATFNWAELLDDGIDELSFSNIAWDVSQLDSSGVRHFLLFLLVLSCLFGHDGFGVKCAFFRSADLKGSILILTLVLLQVLDVGLELSDLVALDVSVSFLSLSVAHLGTKILLLSLDLEVWMPHVVSVKHSDVLVTSDGIITFADAKRVKNWISQASFSVALCHWHFRLHDARIEMFDNGTRVFKLSLLDRLAQFSYLGEVSIGDF